MFLYLLVGYAGLMALLAVGLIVQELLAVAADQRAFKNFHDPEYRSEKGESTAERFIEMIEHRHRHTRKRGQDSSQSTLSSQDLQDELEIMPFPLQSYLESSYARPLLKDIMLYIRNKKFPSTSSEEQDGVSPG